MSSSENMESTLKAGGANTSVTPSIALLNQRLGTSPAPRMLTPSEVDLLRQCVKEASGVALEVLAKPKTEHVLLTVLGNSPQQTLYSFNEREWEAKVAPIALFQLLPEHERPDRVLALCTPAAKQVSWPLLEKGLGQLCRTEVVDVSGAATQAGINDFVAAIASAVPPNADLTVDVTHGFRHFSFLTYVGVLYLAALRGVSVRGAYYGMLNSDTPSPFLDLRPLLELPRWVHALQVQRDTGSALPIAEALGSERNSSWSHKITQDLRSLSEAYLSGLPLELGQTAHEIRRTRLKPLKRGLKSEHSLPLADELVAQLGETLEHYMLPEPSSGEGWKKRVKLTKDELTRQARVIDSLLRHRNTATALRLMSEWAISWVVWRSGGSDEWLDYGKVRHVAAGRLGAMGRLAKSPNQAAKLTTEQHALGKFWNQISGLRNGYAHQGMRGEVLVGSKQQSDKNRRDVLGYWNDTLKSAPRFSLDLGPSGKVVLVTPVGLRPGVLFSAIQACRMTDEPTLCLVICSEQTEGSIAEALGQAEYDGRIERLQMKDAFSGGVEEIERLAEAAVEHLVGASVRVNVTGGTTLMGLATEQIAGKARQLACPVRRFGLIDRRSPSEQDEDPYQPGRPFWLDEEDGNADDN